MTSSITIDFSLDEIEFLQNFNCQQAENPNFDRLIISNVTSYQNGCQILLKSWFKVKIMEINNLFGITFEVDEKIDENFNQEPPLYHFEDTRVILIGIESKKKEFGSKIFWRAGSSAKTYSVLIEDDDQKIISNYVQELLINEIKAGRTGILEQFKSKNNIKLHEIGDEDGNDLLNIAIAAVESKIVKKLLKHEFILDDAVDLAWEMYQQSNDARKEEANKIILHLLHANSSLPEEFIFESASDQVQKFIEMCESLHKDVESDNFSALKIKLDENPHLIHFYDRNNKSLLAHALIHKKYGIFQFLVKGITVGSHEELPDVFENLSEQSQKELRSKHSLNAFELPDSYIFKLKLKTRIGNNEPFADKKWKHIDEAYQIMSKNSFIEKVMKIAAECNKLQIYLDFKHDSVYYLDPAASLYSSGRRIYGTRTIYVGAKYLQDDEGKYEVIGVLAHELCHVSTRLAFMNINYDPFPTGNSTNKAYYLAKVMTQCEKLKDSECLIANVFASYHPVVQDSEMIVTVPQMMMQYYENPEKIDENERIFNELFGYARSVVEPEYEKALPVLKNLFDVEMKITYSALTEPMKANILYSKVNFQGVSCGLFDIIGDDKEILNCLTSDDIRKVLVRGVKLKVGETIQFEGSNIFIKKDFVRTDASNHARPDKIMINSPKINLVEILAQSNVFLLADHAGMGKTVTFKNLTLEFKNKNVNYWVSYINLRKFRNVFEKYATKFVNLNIDGVMDILLQIIGQKSETEQRIFKKCFYNSRTIFFFDGFDEISPIFNGLLLKIFKTLAETKLKNFICVATRLHHARKLEEVLETSAYKFSPCCDGEVREYISKVLESKGFLGTHKDLLELLMFEKISHCFMNPLHSKWTLLIVQMIIDLLLDNLFQDLNADEYSIYAMTIERQKKKLGLKVENEDSDKLNAKLTIWDVHTVLALLVFFDTCKMEVNVEDFNLVRKWKWEMKRFKNQPIWTSDSVQRYGFVTVDDDFSINSIEFSHKSFAEYFVAKFIVESICDDNFDMSEAELEKIFAILNVILTKNYEFEMIQRVISNYMVNEWQIDKKEFNDTIRDLLIEKIKDIHQEMKNGRSTLFYDYFYICLGDKKLSFKLWDLNENSKIQTLSDVQKAIFNLNFATIFIICQKVESVFDLNFLEILNKSGKKLITDVEAEPLRTPKENEIEWKTHLFYLKIFDFIDKNFESSEKIRFIYGYNLLALNNFKVITRIFQMFSDSVPIKELGQQFLLVITSFGNQDDFLSDIFQIIETKFENDLNRIRTDFYEKEFLSTLLGQIIRSLNAHNLQLLNTIIGKYKYSGSEIREIILIVLTKNFKFVFDSKLYSGFKSFITEHFGNDLEELKEFTKNYIDGGMNYEFFKTFNSFKDNFKDFVKLINLDVLYLENILEQSK